MSMKLTFFLFFLNLIWYHLVRMYNRKNQFKFLKILKFIIYKYKINGKSMKNYDGYDENSLFGFGRYIYIWGGINTRIFHLVI